MGRTVASQMGRTLSRLTLNGLADITAPGRGAASSPQSRFREEGFMRRTVQVGLSLLAVLVLLVSVGGTASAHQAGTTYLKVKGAHSPNHPHQSGNLFYHGGAIEQAAKVYIVWWGSQWASSGAAQTYVSNFFSGVGGSSWANSTTQYCQGVPAGTVQCGSNGNLSYSYMPYQPDAGAACGQNFVNANGYFDGFSIVGGHEYAETITDPYPNSGWLDGRGAENGDKCAWISSGTGAAQDISL